MQYFNYPKEKYKKLVQGAGIYFTMHPNRDIIFRGVVL